MKRFRKLFGRQRLFLSVILLPLIGGTQNCPPPVEPPPEPNLSCQTNLALAVQARRCSKVEPPCFASQSWRAGDTFEITGSAENQTAPLAFNRLELQSNRIGADGTFMRRVCQSPYFAENFTGGPAEYEYTFQGNLGVGRYNAVITNHSALTVEITGLAWRTPLVYDRPEDEVAQFLAVPGGGTPPYTFAWFRNGVLMVNESNESILDVPVRTSEYRVRITDQAGGQALSAAVVFMESIAGDPSAAFTATPESVVTTQPTTINPSTSTGPITRWEWDFDWQGDVLEPFDSTINGTNGTTSTSWSVPGRKYVRLRVTTASGNFDETFRRVTVVFIPSRGK